MHRRTMRCAAVAAALFGLNVAGAQAQDARVTEEKKVNDRTVTLTVATSAFAAPTNVDVIFPTGYDADPQKRWPVTYVTAGIMNNYDSFRKVVKGVELTKDYPSIIVSPDGNSGWWSDWYNGGAFGPPAYETFVIDELLPLIDQRYRTVPRRSHRLIAGISMGGYGTIMFAARHPDLFAAASTMSGAVDTNNPLIGAVLTQSPGFDGGAADAIYGPRSEQEVRWRGHNPWDLAENLHDVDVQVRTANGTLNPGIGENPASADTASCVVEGGVYMGSVSFHERLAAIGKQHVWQDYGAGCHTVPNFVREIKDTLEVFKHYLADPRPDPATFDFKAIEPRFDIWGWQIAADPKRALQFLRVQGSRDGVTLTGSGRTEVTSPPWYRGLKRVDVNGTPTAPDAAGRVHFGVDLGTADTTQQYTEGARVSARTGKVALAPHAVIRLTKVTRTRRGLRACVRALGGTVAQARLAAGRARRTLAIDASARCVTLASRGASRITVRGRDGFGHAVSATATAKAKR